MAQYWQRSLCCALEKDALLSQCHPCLSSPCSRGERWAVWFFVPCDCYFLTLSVQSFFFLHSTQVLLEKSFCKVSLPNSPCIHWGYQGLRYLYPLFLYRIFRDKSKTEINMLIFESTLLKIILSRSYPREIAQGFKLFISSKEYLSNCKNIRSQFPEVERQHPHPF